MIALLRKDFRFYRPAIIGGTILLAAPYFLFLISFFCFSHSSEPSAIYVGFCGAAVTSLFLSIVMAAVFGGISLSQERREGWADFTAMLPVGRSRLMASKIIISLAFLTTAWILNILVFAISQNFAQLTFQDRWTEEPVIYVFTSALFTAFSCGWLLSTFLKSPTFSASISITLAIAIIIFPDLWPRVPRGVVGHGPLGDGPYPLLIAINLVLGGISLAIGCLYYPRRVEP